MKKAWIFLIVAALLAFSVPVFADTMGPTVKFSMLGFWWANYDPSISVGDKTVNGGAERIWPTADVVFDTNNTLEIGLRMGGGPSVSPAGSNVNQGFSASLWHFMWTSDLTGAAGMTNSPVDVKVTIGLMDSVLTNWWYDNNGWEWEYGAWSKVTGNNWDAGLITINQDSNFLGYGLAIGVGPVIFHWVNDFSLQNTLVGAEASVMGLGLYVAYGQYGNNTLNYGAGAIGTGQSTNNLAVEAKYAVPQLSGITLTPSAFFRTALDPSEWAFGGDLSIGFQMFKLVLGATTTSTYSLQHYSGTLWINPVDPAQLWIAAYLDGSSSNALQAVDIGASYKFGAFKLIVGWEVGGSDQTGPANGTAGTNGNVTLGNDNVGAIRNGLYFGSAINF